MKMNMKWVDLWNVGKFLLLFIFSQLAAILLLIVGSFIYSRVTQIDPFFQMRRLEMMAWVPLLGSFLIIGHILFWRSFDLKVLRISELKQKPFFYTFLLAMLAVMWITVLNDCLQPEDYLAEYFSEALKSPIGILAIVLLGPIAEEFIFRGGIQRCLQEQTQKPYLSIAISATLFGLIHGNPAQILGAGLIGICLGWVYYCTHNLWYPIFFHTINNFIATVDFVRDGELTNYILAGGTFISLGIGLLSLLLSLFLMNKMKG